MHFKQFFPLFISYYRHPSSSPIFMMKLSLLLSRVINGFGVVFFLSFTKVPELLLAASEMLVGKSNLKERSVVKMDKLVGDISM